MDDGVKLSLLGVWMALFTIFAARKFTQPIKVVYTTRMQLILTVFLIRLVWFVQDDIGDKSVFMFNALPEEEKAALIQKLEKREL